jgi:hypothetical protein
MTLSRRMGLASLLQDRKGCRGRDVQCKGIEVGLRGAQYSCAPAGPGWAWRGVAGTDPVFAEAGGARGAGLALQELPGNFSLH